MPPPLSGSYPQEDSPHAPWRGARQLGMTPISRVHQNDSNPAILNLVTLLTIPLRGNHSHASCPHFPLLLCLLFQYDAGLEEQNQYPFPNYLLSKTLAPISSQSAYPEGVTPQTTLQSENFARVSSLKCHYISDLLYPDLLLSILPFLLVTTKLLLVSMSLSLAHLLLSVLYLKSGSDNSFYKPIILMIF